MKIKNYKKKYLCQNSNVKRNLKINKIINKIFNKIIYPIYKQIIS